MNKEQAQLLADNLICVDQVISLGGCWTHPADQLEDLISLGYERAVLMSAGFKELELDKLEDRWDSCWVSDILQEGEISGYLVKVAIPTPAHTKLDEFSGRPVHGMHSWGYTMWKWLYVWDLDGVVQLAIDWKNEMCGAAHAKQEGAQ